VLEERVAAAVLLRNDQVLLCHRSPMRRWYPDVWDFPGGHVEAGERPLAALARELREELGVEVGGVEAGPILEFTTTNGVVVTVWVCKSWRGVVANLQPEEHDEIDWFSQGELPGLVLADPCYLPILKRLLG